MAKLGFFVGLILCLLVRNVPCAEVRWRHLSSASGNLALPSEAKLQAGSLVGDFDGDGTNDFILAFADTAPSLVLYRGATNWSHLAIELEFLPLSPGGAALDIDQDGDLDAVFGSEKSEIWWWENPNPNFDRNKAWTRHLIQSGGIHHRGQLFADLNGSGRPQLVFWNQGPDSLFWTPIPPEPRTRSAWEPKKIFSGSENDLPGKAEALSAADINMDGTADLLAGNVWFKRQALDQFVPTRIGTMNGISAMGRFREGTFPQVVIAPRGAGTLLWYECKSHPDQPGSWAGRELLKVGPIGTLATGDIDQDGNDDILVAEEAKSRNEPAPRAWIIYSDGRGNFRSVRFPAEAEMFAAKLADLDHDGDLDILSTPHTVGASRLDLWLNETKKSGPVTFPK